jgi:holo-ACP synthase CitX
MDALKRILQGRDERSSLQSWLFEKGLTVIQVSLNVPGFPKRLAGDLSCIDQLAMLARDAIISSGGMIRREIGVLNGAGYAVLLGSLPGESPCRLKRRCIALEESLPWGRAFDLDVLTPAGSVSRQTLGEPPRRCLLCGEEAKSCAREGRHDRTELRRVLEDLLRRSFQDAGSSFPSRDCASRSSSCR